MTDVTTTASDEMKIVTERTVTIQMIAEMRDERTIWRIIESVIRADGHADDMSMRMLRACIARCDVIAEEAAKKRRNRSKKIMPVVVMDKTQSRSA